MWYTKNTLKNKLDMMMANVQNIQGITNYSPTYFLSRFHIWRDFQCNDTPVHAANLDERLAQQFSSAFIGPRHSLLDPNLAKLYQLFAKNDAKPNDFESFMAFLARWLTGNSSFYLKLASHDSDDSTISTEFDLEAATNRLIRAIKQNASAHFDEQQIIENKQIMDFADGDPESIKTLLNSSIAVPEALILNKTLKQYRQQLSAITDKRRFLPLFLAELAAFGSSTDTSIDINVFLTKLSKGGLALTDAEIADTKLYYVERLAEKAFIQTFSKRIADYYQGCIDFEEVWQPVFDHLKHLEQDSDPLPSAKFFPRLEFLLSLIKLQGANAKQDALSEQIQSRFISYALTQYEKKADIEVNTKDYITSMLKEKGYTINCPALSSMPLASSAQVPPKNTNRIKQFVVTMLIGIRDAIAATGRFLVAAVTWFVSMPSLLFNASYRFAAQAMEDSYSPVRDKSLPQLNGQFGSNAAKSLHAATPSSPAIAAPNQTPEAQTKDLAATLAQHAAATAKQRFYLDNKDALPKNKEQPQNKLTDNLPYFQI